MDFFGSGQGQVGGSCVNGNKTSDSINVVNFLTKILLAS